MDIPKGHALVPIKPTAEMIRAGNRCDFPVVGDIWQAMLKAAPPHEPVEDDGLCACESCEKRVPHDEIVAQEDVDLCRACYSEWKAIFDACKHAWRPAFNQMSEPAHICDHCSACIADESFPALFGHPAPERTAEPVTF